MPRIQQFSKGSTIIAQGDTDAVAYLVKDGWLQMQRKETVSLSAKAEWHDGRPQ